MHPRSFVTTCHPSVGRRPNLGRRKLVATRVTVLEAVRAASIRLHPPIFNERTLNASYFRGIIYQSWLDRSVERIEDGCILIFINCPRGQRNYFVNHRRGKMMFGIRCVNCLLVILARGSGGGPRSSFFIFARLIRRVKGVVSIKRHQPPLFRFTCTTKLDRLRSLSFVPSE